MFSYKNTSLSVKTFYGVTFKPGETRDVTGFINDPSMIRVKEAEKPAPAKAAPAKAASSKTPETAKSTQQESAKPAEKKQNESNKEKEETEGGEFNNGTSHN